MLALVVGGLVAALVTEDWGRKSTEPTTGGARVVTELLP